MGYWKHNANVTATVPLAIKVGLEKQAAMAGLSLSKYVAEVLQHIVPAEYGARGVYCRPARLHCGSFVVTIPREIIDGLSIRDKQPLAWSLGRGSALVRLVV